MDTNLPKSPTATVTHWWAPFLTFFHWSPENSRKMPLWKSLCTSYLLACQVSYHRRFRSLLLSSCNAFGVLIMFSVSWWFTNVPCVIQSRLAAEKPSHCIHPVMCQLAVSTTLIQPSVSTTLIKLCINRCSALHSFNQRSAPVIQLRDNQWSALHSFNRRSAPHSSSYASTSGQAPHSFNWRSAPHSSSSQLPSVYHAQRTSHLRQFTAELSPKPTGSIVNEHNLPVVLSTTADSSTSNTHT